MWQRGVSSTCTWSSHARKEGITGLHRLGTGELAAVSVRVGFEIPPPQRLLGRSFAPSVVAVRIRFCCLGVP
jgi:hypothetical protein